MKPSDQNVFKQQALQWANSFDVCCYLDSNGYADPYGKFDWLIAAGAKHQLKGSNGDAFQSLYTFYEQHKSYLFGFLSYDLKNETEDIYSANPDLLEFPELFFFVPEYLIASRNGNTELLSGDAVILKAIKDYKAPPVKKCEPMSVLKRLTKEAYLQKIEKLQQHIRRGDIYEVNFCQEFFAENAYIHPLTVFNGLNSISPTPFSGYFKMGSHFILSATPERFLAKRGSQLISQPIKGTAKRSTDLAEDQKIKAALRNNPKEQAENVMIVDLVRHDLTKCAIKGSVHTKELFGTYTFPQVHQLISTICCTIDPKINLIEAIKNCFPMGSMTGAPKLKAMQLIEIYEETKRGLYSGTFGWIGPEGNFDFNVVIRTLLYNAEKKYLSFQVGGAITYASDPDQEYEECLLKASAILKVLNAADKKVDYGL